MAAAAVGLLTLAGVHAIAVRGDSFPARTQALSGAPVELRVQSGVGAREVRAIADGVRRSHRFIRSALGRTVRGPVVARIARADTCPGADGDRSVIGQGGAGELCLDTANVEWQWLIRNHPEEATSLPAHEYVHVLQAQLGCLPTGDDRDFRWIVEGMASHIGWEALVWSGRVDAADVAATIRRDGAFDPEVGPLRQYERRGGRTPQYAQWHLAVRHLLDAAVSAGFASPARPEAALIRFCERVGAGRTWRGAFLASFGLSVFDFYARFEEAVWGRRGSQAALTLP